MSSETRMILNITDEERSVAQQIRKEFKELLKKIDISVEVVKKLKDSIAEQKPSKKELREKYRGRLLRFRRKIKKHFNEFLEQAKPTLEKMSKVSDPDMVRLRELIISELDELSDGAEKIMDLLGESDLDGFTKKLETVVGHMDKRQKSINDVIENQLFSHIEQDILGKMKISEIKFRIQKRSRIMKQLARQKCS